MVLIEVRQDGATVKFAFKKEYFNDAIKFAGDCIETGEPGTKVSIAVEED